MTQEFGPLTDQILPITIREGVIVRFFGIPHDLTPAEAAKLGRVVKAFAVAGTAEPLSRPGRK